MKTVAYLRVSTSRRDVRGQRLAILEYARRQRFEIEASQTHEIARKAACRALTVPRDSSTKSSCSRLASEGPKADGDDCRTW